MSNHQPTEWTEEELTPPRYVSPEQWRAEVNAEQQRRPADNHWCVVRDVAARMRQDVTNAERMAR